MGHLIDGTQAEYVRVPFAGTSTCKVPAGTSDEEVLMLADIDAARFITHRFGLGDILAAYDVLGNASGTGAIKVVMTRS